MPIDALHLDLSEVEAEIASLLSSAVDVDSSGQLACEQFGIVLANVFRSLPGNRPTRYWTWTTCRVIPRIESVTW